MPAIPRRIPRRSLGQQVLARPFCDDDHHVPISFDALSGRPDDPIKGERNFRDETQSDLGIRQRGEAGDEPGVAAHQLHQTDTEPMARRLHVGRSCRLTCRLDRGVESE